MLLPRVSVIVPTYSRPEYHEPLYRTFTAATYPSKELRVLDDSAAPSPFFSALRDPRVRYMWTPQRASIGTKRNELVAGAAGSVIVHQDDDDPYHPTWIETIVGRLGRNALTKSSNWILKSEYDGTFWRWDTRSAGPVHFAVSGSSPAMRVRGMKQTPGSIEAARLGYGFSYCFQKSAWACAPFDDLNLGEDLAFARKLKQFGSVTDHGDLSHLIVHVAHRQSTSRAYPQHFLGGWPKVTDAPADFLASQEQQVAGDVQLEPGKTYDVTAAVKESHSLGQITAKASSYGLSVIKAEDNVAPSSLGLPMPGNGYRYIRARAKALRSGKVPQAVPAPFSWLDKTRVVQVSVSA